MTIGSFIIVGGGHGAPSGPGLPPGAAVATPDPSSLPAVNDQEWWSANSPTSTTIFNANDTEYQSPGDFAAAPAGKYILDFETGVKIWKLTDEDTDDPDWIGGGAPNDGCWHGYSTPAYIGWPNASGDYTIILGGEQINSGFLRFRRGAGPQTIGALVFPATANGSPGNLTVAMSRNPDTPEVAYLLNANGLEMFDTSDGSSLGVLSPNADGGSAWLLNSHNDEVIAWQDPRTGPTTYFAYNHSGTNLGGSWPAGTERVIDLSGLGVNECQLTANGRYMFGLLAGAPIPVWDLYTDTRLTDTQDIGAPHTGMGWDYIIGSSVNIGDSAPTGHGKPEWLAYDNTWFSDTVGPVFWGGHSTSGWINPNDSKAGANQWYVHANGRRSELTEGVHPNIDHIAFVRPDGSDARLLCFGYGNSDGSAATDPYYSNIFPTLSPDGLVVVFNSVMDVVNGRLDVYAAEVPS